MTVIPLGSSYILVFDRGERSYEPRRQILLVHKHTDIAGIKIADHYPVAADLDTG
jgi:hypothetical protein